MSPNPRLRLDCAITGPEVYLLGRAGDHYIKVQSVRSGARFETPLARLRRPTSAPVS